MFLLAWRNVMRISKQSIHFFYHFRKSTMQLHFFSFCYFHSFLLISFASFFNRRGTCNFYCSSKYTIEWEWLALELLHYIDNCANTHTQRRRRERHHRSQCRWADKCMSALLSCEMRSHLRSNLPAHSLNWLASVVDQRIIRQRIVYNELL